MLILSHSCFIILLPQNQTAFSAHSPKPHPPPYKIFSCPVLVPAVDCPSARPRACRLCRRNTTGTFQTSISSSLPTHIRSLSAASQCTLSAPPRRPCPPPHTYYAQRTVPQDTAASSHSAAQTSFSGQQTRSASPETISVPVHPFCTCTHPPGHLSHSTPPQRDRPVSKLDHDRALWRAVHRFHQRCHAFSNPSRERIARLRQLGQYVLSCQSWCRSARAGSRRRRHLHPNLVSKRSTPWFASFLIFSLDYAFVSCSGCDIN
jgi:hypothetical protein